MALSPREHRTLSEIAERLMASDPHLVRLMRHGPAPAHHLASRGEVLLWRAVAAVLFVAAYAVTEWGLISAGAPVAVDGGLVAVLAVCALAWAGHRHRCMPRAHA